MLLIPKTKLLLLVVISFLCSLSYCLKGQEGNCGNAGFEAGSTVGYQTFTGTIDGDGNVEIQTPGVVEDQHRIMRITDGVDPIAERFCDVNNQLPVVPEGGGQYALRLGNDNTGARAERILLEFTVTPERSFFLLSYAVILEDPGHEEFEQPRFELRILSSEGEVLDCGEYRVRASEQIAGFENCGGWRVRPWTTAGFELQSYLGQDIQIEILTTDCSRGGHAGYAYLNASCQPLELRLDGYCPGTTSADLIVTEGFDRYEWSTGETTNRITIANPQANDAYSVTVTSATGCTLVLRDTLPPLEELPAPTLQNFPDTTVCPGSSFWLEPTGTNFSQVFSSTLGFSADSFLISPINSTTYQFTVMDDYGCRGDTLNYTVTVDSTTSIVSTPEVTIDSTTCADSSNGSISLTTNAERIQWNTGSSNNTLSSLAAGRYTARLFDSLGCYIDQTYEVAAPPPLDFSDVSIIEPTCFGDANGSLEVQVNGGTAPYTFAQNQSAGDRLLLTNLTRGNYQASVTDANNCVLAEEFFVGEPPLLTVNITTDSVTCHSTATGQAVANMAGGTPPYSFSWDDSLGQTSSTAVNLSQGLYTVNIVDNNGCDLSANALVEEPLPLRIDQSSVDSTSCHNTNDGSAIVFPTGGNGGYSYRWNDNDQETQRANNLTFGEYMVTVVDRKGCDISDTLAVFSPLPLELTMAQDSVSCFGGSDGQASVSVLGGNGGYSYLWSNTSTDPNISQLNAGLITVTVRDRKGCQMNNQVFVAQPDPLTAEISGQTFPNCGEALPGETTIRVNGGNGGFRYLWQNMQSGPTVSSFNASTFGVFITDLKGCTLTDTFSVLGLDATIIPTGNFINDNLALCSGEQLQLEASANNILVDIYWNSSEPLPCDSCSVLQFIPQDSAWYRLIVRDAVSCLDTVDLLVPVNPYYAGLVAYSGSGLNEGTVCFGEEVRLNYIAFPEATQLVWSDQDSVLCMNCPEVIVRPSDNTPYSLQIAHENGCASLLDTTFIVDRINCAQFIPNAFSPNGDGINDTFTIPSSKAGTIIRMMKVADRYGGILYIEENRSLDNPIRGWDGNYRGKPANKGIYVYEMVIENFDGTLSTYKGDVLLIK